jgi:tRNA threonylcarbamoyl adenosine modification protein YeaZ
MIFRMIDDVLKQVSLVDFDVICFDRGPGAFTGVRIGCGVAQGLGFGKNVPVIGVNSLAAQSLQILQSLKNMGLVHDQLCFIAIDARMGEVYCGIYRLPAQENAELEVVLHPIVCNAEHAVLVFEKHRLEFLNSRLAVGGNAFSEEGLHPSLFLWSCAHFENNMPGMIKSSVSLDAKQIAKAAMLGLAGQYREAAGEHALLDSLKILFPAAQVAPEYVRNSVALDKVQQAQLRLERRQLNN